MPVDQIKGLSPADIDSIRSMLHGSLNPYWAQAINALAVVGNEADADLMKRALDQPMPAIARGANQEVIQQLRDLLKAKLAAPQALGILANRTKSPTAVDILKDTADLDTASTLVGKAASVDLSRNALTGLSIANTPEAQVVDPSILAAKYVRSRSEKGDDVNIVGSPEADIFDIQPLTPGDAEVVFDLGRVKSNPIRKNYCPFSRGTVTP